MVEFRACFSVSDCASCSCADSPVPPGWLPSCYSTFQNLLPAPVVTLEENGVQSVFVAPDSVEFINLLGTDYTSFFDSIGFDWKRLAGAKVLKIEGQDPYAYAKHIAATKSGNYLDHGVRVNSVLSSYRIVADAFSQRFGDLAGPPFPDQDTITFKLILANKTEPETVVAGAVEVAAPLLPLALDPETGAPAVPVAVTTGVETPTVAEVAPEDDPESEPGILD